MSDELDHLARRMQAMIYRYLYVDDVLRDAEIRPRTIRLVELPRKIPRHLRPGGLEAIATLLPRRRRTPLALPDAIPVLPISNPR